MTNRHDATSEGEIARIVIEYDHAERSLASIISDMRESVADAPVEIIDVDSTEDRFDG